MTCERIREELELLVGESRLPAEIAEHLATCPDCAKYWAELQHLVQRLQSNDLFVLDNVEAEQFLSQIDDAIATAPEAKITTLRWLRYAAAAAVITLSVTVGFYEFRNGSPPLTTVPSDSTPVVTTDTSIVADSLALSQEDKDQLIREYTTDMTVTSDDSLLENISDEEIEYLDKNLQVGDLL